MPKIHTVETYRFLVERCRDCAKTPGCNVIMAPRFGIGRRSTSKSACELMIVGQNPPSDPARAKHGAWMLGYPDEGKGPHELLVQSLVLHLGLQVKDVWATQAVKCPTRHNESPTIETYDRCAPRFLESEIHDVHPRVIIAFGNLATYAVECRIGRQPFIDCPSIALNPKGGAAPAHVRARDNFISAPHPSMVGRFFEREDWMIAIKTAYEFAKNNPRPMLRMELQEYALGRPVDYVHRPSIDRWKNTDPTARKFIR